MGCSLLTSVLAFTLSSTSSFSSFNSFSSGLPGGPGGGAVAAGPNLAALRPTFLPSQRFFRPGLTRCATATAQLPVAAAAQPAGGAEHLLQLGSRVESTGYEGAEGEGSCDHACMATHRETLRLLVCVRVCVLMQGTSCYGAA